MGDYCVQDGCLKEGREELCGYCQCCWVNELNEEQQGELLDRFGDEPEDEPQRVVTYTLPAYPGFFNRLFSFLLGSFGGSVGAFLLLRYLGWI
jgi:hypothetical protein